MKVWDKYYNLYKGKVYTRISRKVGQEKFGNSIKQYAHKKMLTADEMNDFIYRGIDGGEPFMVARFGSMELTTVGTFYFNIKKDLQHNMKRLCFNAGFFPNDISLGNQFSDTMLDACANTDALAVWFVQYEEYFAKKLLSSEARISYLMNIEPWKSDHPWTRALKGKKVLVIHPFDESIRAQYKKRELLFPEKEILPEFELKTLKAVQTIAGEKDERFKDWFEALQYMFDEAMKIDFDVAILGCGAYGMPLASMLKKAGKQAVHMGGITQILFGIKGKRWEENDAYSYVKEMMNEHWVYPSDSEKPQNARSVENNCYWG